MELRINEPEWFTMLKEEFKKDYFTRLESKILNDKLNGKIVLPFPNDSMIFRAYELTPLSRVKVVILGQDPYANVKNASGLAFSVPGHIDTPKSLKNIFKELKNDLGIINKYNDLSYWAAQGVLLLNSVLTCIEGESNSHKNYGWQTFTDKSIELVCKNHKSMIYLLMGQEAQKKKQFIIDNSIGEHVIIETAHPSPNSAHTGWFWSKPFSRINEALHKQGKLPIDWKL